MSSLRAALLTALPKVLLSRTCGLMTSIPLPAGLRGSFYRWFARRYSARLEDIDGDLRQFRSLQQFFRRSLRPDARPIADSTLVWPCDGRIVTTGRITDGRIEQVKGQTYDLADLVGDTTLAAALAGGSQATIYLAPGRLPPRPLPVRGARRFGDRPAGHPVSSQPTGRSLHPRPVRA